MRRIESVGLSKSLGLGGLTAAITLALAALSAAPEASAQYRSTANTPVRSSTQVRSSTSTQQRYVSQTTRRVAVPVRNQRVYSAPRGATLLRSRYWDPRTRWIVDSRTHSTYSVLSNGEVWFLEPSSGWAYTVDRYGRVYGADPRRNSIYAFSSLHSWRGDLFYFFDFFSPYDGYYTVRDYDWFYSSYYGRRAPLYDYGYAYRTMWDDFDDYWFSNRFYRSVSFRYYEPAYIRYGSGWSSNYYYNSLPAVYIAPCYSYTVVNNTVVVNNNYYTNNNIVNNNGRGLPSAEQAAVQLAQQVSAPTVFAGNEISAQQIADAGISAPLEVVKEVSVEAAQPVIASEPAVEVPGLVISEGNPTEIQSETQPVSAPTENAGFGEIEKQPAYTEQPVDTQPTDVQPTEAQPTGQPAFEAQKEPVYSEQPVEQAPSYSDERQEPVYQEPAREEPAYQEPAREEPAYQEPAYQEPAYESAREEPAQQPEYQEPAYQEPAYEAVREEPVYQEPAYQEQDNSRDEPAYEEPAYQEPAYQEPAQEQPSYQEPNYQESAREEPSYQQQEQSYEQPSYQQQEQSYEQPSYQQQEQSYEQPSYQQQEQSYEQPEQRNEAPAQSEPSYEQPVPQENSGGM
jgi:hypothetical protein